MARADDDEALRRRGRARTRPPPPTSIASMYAPEDAANRPVPPARSSKMKMASLMAVVDEAETVNEGKNKRVKVNQDVDNWAARNTPISISSLTSSQESSSSYSIAPERSSSVFHNEMPPIIQSFSEERRRDAVQSNGERKNGALVANGDASPATRTMFDFYFPTGKAEANGSSNRSLKRKRRSGRRDETEVDLLRFGVDAAKLVPQGLVDRVDVYMSRAVLVKVVGNHVTNWCNRSGFAPSFLQEISTLLAAYYPCNYPTLLDEVLAGFLFKRPEFMDLLLPAMLEKMSKAGESVSTTKYPVADALTLWRALLPPAQEKASVEGDDLNWQVDDPWQQIVELLAEEGKLQDNLKKQLEDSQSYLIPDCLERSFKYASTSWNTVDDRSELSQKQQSLATQVCRSYYHSMSHEAKKQDEVAIKFAEALNLLLPSHFLKTLKTLASAKNNVGAFTRRVLSSGTVTRLLVALMTAGHERRRQEMLLDVMNVVVASNTSPKLNRDWARQFVVQELVNYRFVFGWEDTDEPISSAATTEARRV
eukprot:jgi/Phyca11/534319/estExt2_fgenesh1_pg.C_PHYCAscaffold_220087